jgi:hypothetical protein
MDEEQGKPNQKSRVRMRSISGQLQKSINDLDDQLDDPKTTAAKRSVVALKKADVLLRLAEMQSMEARDGALAENAELTAQHETDVARITELEAQLEEANRRANTRVVEKVFDGESQKLQRQVEMLTATLSSLYSELDEDQKSRLVVRAALRNFESAKLLMKILNIEPSSVHATLNSKQVELHTALMNNPDGQFSPLNRAVLSLRDGFNGCKVQRSNEPYCEDFQDEC